ncbi:MAG: redoxin domain-containing protein [Acidobacteria bacterium]|nr:redoxin domain-containing protein [Acidobacteriota bacterium]NIM60220.1 redoxin domain-containing protein [Acidobacteriota bacterium]NIO60258.1 redoxin domain-containing protein [Acidobacteriota bacterium]NIQ31313.1 redoxin domain-containing protein [Acidobacteriota bacterium]NIQ86536.1 redoxin domain-containing protein [Acidobacteriota bacterium]
MRRIFVLLAILVFAAVPHTLAQRNPVDPVLPGESFAADTFANFNAVAGGPETVDLAASLGQRAVVLVYWIAGHERADRAMVEIQQIVDKMPTDRAVIYGVAYPQPGRAKPEIVKRLGDLGIRFPVLDDSDFVIGRKLSVQTVPNINIVDRTGKLRLANGASLLQVIGYEQTVGSAIERAVKNGDVGSYGYLERYYPVNELVGKECPDFKAPLLSNSVEQRLSRMIKDDHVNVLIFWSVNCQHCRRELPLINAWLRQNREGLNVISAAGVSDDVTKTRTKEFCDINKFVFPTLVDRDLKISNLYQVTSTPTILFIGPDGVVDSVMLSTADDFGAIANQKKRELLGG